jgi:hypothetical protein
MILHRIAVVSALAGVIVAAGAREAAAQDRSRFGLFGGLEFAQITEDEGRLGGGPGGQAGLSIRLTPATTLDASFGVERHVRNFEFLAANPSGPAFPPVPYRLRWSGTPVFAIGRVAHTFGVGTVRPVAWGGGGVMHHGGTRHEITDDGGLPFTDEERLSVGPALTTWVLDGGGGVDVAAGERFTVRPFGGFRLTGAAGFGPKYILRFGADIGVRW